MGRVNPRPSPAQERAGPPGPLAVAAVLLDDRGAVNGWSAEAERLTGHTFEQVRARTAADLVGARMAAEIAKKCVGRRSWSGNVTVARRDGGEASLDLTVTPIVQPDGRPGWLALAATATRTPWGGDQQVFAGPVHGALARRHRDVR